MEKPSKRVRPLRFFQGEHHEKVTVDQFYAGGRQALSLSLAAGAGGLVRVISEAALNRPGLALTGFYSHFATNRLQILGKHEHAYLLQLDPAERRRRLERLFSNPIPAVILCRGLPPFPELVSEAERTGTPLLTTPMVTHAFINPATLLMEDLFRASANVHGTLIEVYGEGVLLVGRPGTGKSETALGLVKRGHALVSDDSTVLRPDASGHIVGYAAPAIAGYMEIRGIGIIHVPSIFGITAVRGQKQLDLIITLDRSREAERNIDRTGQDLAYREVLGHPVPDITLHVAPGRDIVNLVETAVCEFKLRTVGLPSAERLDRLVLERNEKILKQLRATPQPAANAAAPTAPTGTAIP